MNRSKGRERITPRRTFVVALFTLAAAVASFVAGLLADRLSDIPQVRHLFWHLLWALLLLPIAFGLHRFRSARPATGWTERCLAAANLLVRAIAVGNVLAAAGDGLMYRIRVFEWRVDYLGQDVHAVGGFLAFGSFAILPLVCLVMWTFEVRGARRPTAYAQMPPAP